MFAIKLVGMTWLDVFFDFCFFLLLSFSLGFLVRFFIPGIFDY